MSLYLCKITNNDEGKQFIKFLREHLNRKSWTVALRGRGSNRKGRRELAGLGMTSQMDVPVSTAEELAIYIRHKDKKSDPYNLWVNGILAENQSLMATYERLKKLIDDLHRESSYIGGDIKNATEYR